VLFVNVKRKEEEITEGMNVGKKIVGHSKAIIESLSSKNYYSARMYGMLRRQWWYSRDTEALIIYQMGKVGSTSVYRSLKLIDLGMHVFHVHFLSPEGVSWAENVYKREFSRTNRIERHIFDSLYLRKRIDEEEVDKPWKVITLVRDPIARNLSSFFQTFNLEFPEFGYEHRVKSMPIEDLVAELEALFFEKFYHDRPLTWFDEEMKLVFGVDVFATKFPKVNGYTIYNGPEADVLLFKLEDLNKCASQAFRQFLDVDNFTVFKANEAQDKAYSKVYDQFVERIRIPDSYIDKMYESKYMRHFYSDAEIEKFRAKWIRRSDK